jgi:hypothetical protein
MKHLALVLSVAAASLMGGCASQSQMAKPDARAYQAYIAGQRDATGIPQNRAVTIQGDVKNHMVPWTEDLTVAKALVAAEYKGSWDPHQIWVRRGTNRYNVNVRSLLAGKEDPALEPGDVIEIR